MTVKLFYYYFFYFSAALMLAALLVPMMRSVSFAFGAVDDGKGRRVHTGIVPRLGGIGIFVSFLLPAVFSLTRGEWDLFHLRIAGIIAASLIVFLTGVWDDIKGARVRNKLAAETIAATLVYTVGVRITEVSNPFHGVISLGWMSFPVTVLWIVVITNAFNLIDGMDGLAAGTGLLIIATLFALSGDDLHLRLMFLIMAGSLAGFLFYNFPPASIFMGDSGSLFVGFFLGCISIVSSQKATAMATIMVPLLAFSLPLMDMLYAVMRRYYRGIPLGEADREHIHHKLLHKGFSKKKALFFLYMVNVIVMVSVLLLVRNQQQVDFLGLLLIAAAAVAGLRLLGYLEFSRFFRETFRNWDAGRKRKYFNYVLKRFRHDTAQSKSADELKKNLTVLMKEYSCSSAEIIFDINGAETLFYVFKNGSAAERPVILSFPVSSVDKGLNVVVRLSQCMNGDNFLCANELVAAISEEVGRFIENNSCNVIAEKEM